MPIAGMGKSGKWFGHGPNYYELTTLVGRRIETQFILNYTRRHFLDSEWHQGLISRKLRYWYGNKASADQKDTVTRLKLRQDAQWHNTHGRGFFADIFGWEPWSELQRKRIGAKLIAIVQSTCIVGYTEDEKPVYLFQLKQSGKHQYVELSEAGLEWTEHWDVEAGKKAFTVLPMLCPPRPHTHDSPGGYLDVAAPIINATVSGEWKAKFEMSELHLQLLNKLQRQSFQVNVFILSVMEQLLELRGSARMVGKFKPLPFRDDYVDQLPADLREKTGLSEKQLEAREEKIKAIAEQHRAFKRLEQECKSSMSMETVDAARRCKDDERFFIPAYADFRGRSYPRAVALSFQGRDFQKALLLWADPVEVDEQTEWWMRVGMSGDMGFDKLSFDDRWAVIDEHRERIIQSVRDPIGTNWWKDLDSPWMFLAVASEWVRLYVDNDPDRTTACRVSIDATCSGQQHMALLTRSGKTARQVNLTSADRPQDVYRSVLEVAVAALQRDNFVVMFKSARTMQPIPKKKLKALAETHPLKRSAARKGAKAIILVSQYGAGRARRISDFAEKVDLSWLDNGTFTEAEARALYPYFQEGLDECLPALDAFLEWVQSVVYAAFKNGAESILVPTPDGSVFEQRYQLMERKQITLDHPGPSPTPRGALR